MHLIGRGLLTVLAAGLVGYYKYKEQFLLSRNELNQLVIRFQERLQDSVPNLHGECLVGVQDFVQQGARISWRQGDALLYCLQHASLQL